MIHRLKGTLESLFTQQRQMIVQCTNEQYSFTSNFFKASIGGHIRHTLDHLRLPICSQKDLLEYDQRVRNSSIEKNPVEALQEIDRLSNIVSDNATLSLNREVRVGFQWSSDQESWIFESNVQRELAFAIHHAIHHHSTIKYIIEMEFPDSIILPKDFGMAPSTMHYHKK